MQTVENFLLYLYYENDQILLTLILINYFPFVSHFIYTCLLLHLKFHFGHMTQCVDSQVISQSVTDCSLNLTSVIQVVTDNTCCYHTKISLFED